MKKKKNHGFHRCKLLPANLQMDWWCQNRERKWCHHHASRQQDRSRREEVILPTFVCVHRKTSFTPTIMMHNYSCLTFSQANYDWGGGAESQRAECHVYRDQCQNRIQCQTGKSCTFTIFHMVFGCSHLLVPRFSLCLHPEANTIWENKLGLNHRKQTMIAAGHFMDSSPACWLSFIGLAKTNPAISLRTFL